MSARSTIAQLDRLVEPFGFNGRKGTWNRITGSFVDVIELQVSKASDTATLNVGILDPDVYRLLWNNALSNFAEESKCTVTARIGELVDGKDLWWQVDAVGTVDELADNIARRVLPFLDKMHDRQAMKQWLISNNVVKRRYPPPIINLAILEYLLGDVVKGCAILADLQKAAIGAWKDRVAEVARRLGCAAESS